MKLADIEKIFPGMSLKSAIVFYEDLKEDFKNNKECRVDDELRGNCQRR